jgi:predicted metal-dependent hydrolase
MQQQFVTTPSGQFEYSIVHRSRVTKRLHLELDATGGLVVVAPKHWSRSYIHQTLSQNTGRLARFVAKARERLLPPLQYSAGEAHLFLGESYPLMIVDGVHRKTEILLAAQELQVKTSRCGAQAIRLTLQDWYRQQAAIVFAARMEILAGKAPWVKRKLPSLRLRRMKRTWGNCSSKGVIKLNTHLVKTPLAIVDSVIAHELCHLEEMNHGKAFYALLEGLNPNWHADRAMLRSHGHIYLRS